MICEKVNEALLEIRNERGELTPDAVVEVAKDPDSPLHKYFEWSDSGAAHKYRVYQARNLIKRVRVDVNITKTEVRPVPAYVESPSKDGGAQGYSYTPELKKDPDAAWKAVQRELDYANRALERARNVAIALDMQDRIAEVIDRIEQLKAA